MRTISFLLLVFLLGCKSEQTTIPTGLVTEKAMVVSAREEASQIGVEIMKQGGNAFDAMIATELALAVAYPYAGNIGGGGFMVYRKFSGETGSLDYREKAPMAATSNLFLDENGNVINGMSTESAKSVGVPGTIAGVFAVHEKFGTLPIETILKPVIELAKKGVVVTQKQEERLHKYREAIVKANGDKTLFSKVFKEKDTIRYFALANTLEQIAKNGRDEFYKGETAKKLVMYIQTKGGIITLEDLEKYEAVWRDPISFDYKNYKVTSMAPPSSGGITLGQILKMIEPYDVHTLQHNSEKYIQLLVEVERRAYADRNHYLGDPDFVKIIFDENNEPIAFVVGLPDMSKGLKKARGRLFPFGFIHILLDARKNKQLDLLLGAVKPNYRGLGLTTILGVSMIKAAQKRKMEFMDTHLVLETNHTMRGEAEKLNGEVYKKYRIF